MDESIYWAEEINFHSPSEHTLEGKKFDLEMQVLFYGRSKGSIDKQVSLSFMFVGSPQVQNKLFDKFNFYNLPNPLEPNKTLLFNGDLFIPHVLYDFNEPDSYDQRQFSFFQYDGSLSFPPCTERTTVFVASNPIRLSKIILESFKEAIKAPEENLLQNDKPSTKDFSRVSETSNRTVQPLNGRVVMHFQADTLFTTQKAQIKEDFHYEKLKIKSDARVFVPTNEPSGIPGAVYDPNQDIENL